MATVYFFALIPLVGFGWFYRTVKDDASHKNIILPLLIIDTLFLSIFVLIPIFDLIFQIIFIIVNIQLYRNLRTELKIIGRPISSMNSVDRNRVHKAIQENDIVTISNLGKYIRYDEMQL